MIGRVLEIQEDGRHLSLFRGFLLVSVEKEEITRIPLSDIAVIIASAYQLTYTHALLLELSQRGIGFIACGTNHLPAAILWPVDGHHYQTGVMLAQVDAGQPLRKQLWKTIVQVKIRFQQEVLTNVGVSGTVLNEIADRVRSGDPDNFEAQAARRYWPLLMGEGFFRDRGEGGVNALLNYGYSIIRSGVARAIMASGLHPTLGIFHRNKLNPMCLVDDIMEPFRPLVDWEVYLLQQEGIMELSPAVKKRLALLLLKDCAWEGNVTPVSVAMLRTAQSLAKSFQENNSQMLRLPENLFTIPK